MVSKCKYLIWRESKDNPNETTAGQPVNNPHDDWIYLKQRYLLSAGVTDTMLTATDFLVDDDDDDDERQ